MPVALITGGARRVGRAIALGLASAGYDIAITYNKSADDAQSLEHQVKAMGRQALLIQANLADLPSAVHAVHSSFISTFDRLDVLVNNASVYKPAKLADTTLALIREANTLHLEAPLLLCQKFATLLRTSKGSVINMIDVMAERPMPTYLAYCASKGALLNLTLGLAREFVPDVRVNGIAPGTVEWAPNVSAEQKETYIQRVPLKRIGSPEEVAKLAIYLARDATYQTGQILRIDGGRSIQ